VAEAGVILGEVHTGLLQNSSAVSPDLADDLLQLLRGEHVRRSTRPIAHSRSPEILTGIDCDLPATSGAQIRAVGTVVSRANIIGNHVVQGSSYASVDRQPRGRRLPWSHYLSRRGTIETVGRAAAGQIVDGFLATSRSAESLDLAALSDRVLTTVQGNVRLDHRVAFKSERIALRWSVNPEHPGDEAAFVIGPDGVRRLTLPHRDRAPGDYAAFCEDLAMHDWLLTTLTTLVQRSRIGAAPRAAVLSRLAPAIDHLLHLWMPAARADSALLDVWHGFEAHPGFSRQWQVNVDRVRDQLSLSIAERIGGG